MWPFKNNPRRLAVRADATEAQNIKRVSSRRLGPAVAIAGVFFLLATAILYYPSDGVPYRVGEKAPVDLRSPVDLTVEDPVQTQRDRDAARDTGAVLLPDVVALGQIRSHLMNLPEDVRPVTAVNQLPPEISARWPGLSNSALQWLHQVPPDVYRSDVETLLSALAPLPLVDKDTAAKVAHQQSELIYVAEGGSVDRPLRTLMRRDVMASRSADTGQRKELRDLIVKNGAFPLQMADVLVDYVLQTAPAIYRYSAQEHEKLTLSQAGAVTPAGLHIRKGELIAAQGDEITSSTRQQLVLAQRQYEMQMRTASPWLWILAHAGDAISVLVITLIGALYVTQMNPGLNTTSRGWALVGLLLVTLFIAKGSVSAGLYNAVFMLGVALTLLTTIILVIAFNQRFAFVISSLHALLVTLALGMDAQFFLVVLTGITIFTFGLKEIRTRGKLIEIGVFASAALLLCVWALGMARLSGSVWVPGTLAAANVSTFVQTLALNSLWAASAGIGVGFVTLGILPFIERVFKITTAMTLLELCDLNQPLLKRLSQEAAGTFNHSLVVGTLAEAAGNAIGANGLLCRVGAYYHDIGKLSKPLYFIENQSGGPNRHDKLSPAMSLLIIVGHVKDGVELAREYHLPWIVHQFIAQHHGTTLVEYFYHAAKEQMNRAEGNSGGAGQVTEAEFRYAGPRPQTRETAILMICDGVESMVRALAEPTAGRMEATVHQLVMKRLMDGQFAHCDLTLRDLGLIEQSLVHTLAGVYHGRVAYPKPLVVSRPA